METTGSEQMSTTAGNLSNIRWLTTVLKTEGMPAISGMSTTEGTLTMAETPWNRKDVKNSRKQQNATQQHKC